MSTTPRRRALGRSGHLRTMTETNGETMDLRTLEPRLENWARAQRFGGYGGADIASAEGRYRGGGWRELRPAPPVIDHADAVKVNNAWQRLMPLDKDVLKLYYVRRSRVGEICRVLRLKQGKDNAHVWDFALYHAQMAISDRLEKADGLVNPIRLAYTPPLLMTDSVD